MVTLLWPSSLGLGAGCLSGKGVPALFPPPGLIIPEGVLGDPLGPGNLGPIIPLGVGILGLCCLIAPGCRITFPGLPRKGAD